MKQTNRRSTETREDSQQWRETNQRTTMALKSLESYSEELSSQGLVGELFPVRVARLKVHLIQWREAMNAQTERIERFISEAITRYRYYSDYCRRVLVFRRLLCGVVVSPSPLGKTEVKPSPTERNQTKLSSQLRSIVLNAKPLAVKREPVENVRPRISERSRSMDSMEDDCDDDEQREGNDTEEDGEDSESSETCIERDSSREKKRKSKRKSVEIKLEPTSVLNVILVDTSKLSVICQNDAIFHLKPPDRKNGHGPLKPSVLTEENTDTLDELRHEMTMRVRDLDAMRQEHDALLHESALVSHRTDLRVLIEEIVYVILALNEPDLTLDDRLDRETMIEQTRKIVTFVDWMATEISARKRNLKPYLLNAIAKLAECTRQLHDLVTLFDGAKLVKQREETMVSHLLQTDSEIDSNLVAMF